MNRLSRVFALLAAAPFLSVAVPMPATAAALTAELQKQVRAATFEVVIRKPVTDSVTYEKPLPLTLVPYIERTDSVWLFRHRSRFAPLPGGDDQRPTSISVRAPLLV